MRPVIKYTVNVPQGKSARLLLSSEKTHGFDALFTSGFSCCCIFACISKERLALIHFDQQSNIDQLMEEIAWAQKSGSAELILIFRESHRHILADTIAGNLRAHGVSTTLYKMDDEHDGVMLAFPGKDGSDIHPQIQKHPLGCKPGGLLSHPQEQRIEAVQKIEQIIGLKHRVETEGIVPRWMCIFDGRNWELMQEHELSICQDDDITRREIAFFKKADDYVTIAGKLEGIVESCTEITFYESMKEIILPVAMYLEGYLNEFNALRLLRRNLLHLLDSQNERSIHSLPDLEPSDDDRQFCLRFCELLKCRELTYEQINRAAEEYKATEPNTKFKTHLLDEYGTFSRHFYDRSYYDERKVLVDELSTRARLLANAGKDEFGKRNLPAAVNLFGEVLVFCSQCCCKGSEMLSTAYYNYGRSLQCLERYQEADFLLNASFVLRSNYEKSNHVGIKKAKSAWEECRLALSAQGPAAMKAVLH